MRALARLVFAAGIVGSSLAALAGCRSVPCCPPPVWRTDRNDPFEGLTVTNHTGKPVHVSGQMGSGPYGAIAGDVPPDEMPHTISWTPASPPPRPKDLTVTAGWDGGTATCTVAATAGPAATLKRANLDVYQRAGEPADAVLSAVDTWVDDSRVPFASSHDSPTAHAGGCHLFAR